MPDQPSYYEAAYAAWQAEPGSWWADKAGAIDWTRPPERSFDPGLSVYGQWFPGGELNMSYNCLDRHVTDGRGDQPALIWDSPMTGEL